MEAFGRWWRRHDTESLEFKDEILFQDIEDEVGKSWRAALEWMKVKLENYTAEDVLYFIDNELEE